MMVVVQQRYADAVDKPKQWYWRSVTIVTTALAATAALAIALALRLYRSSKPWRA